MWDLSYTSACGKWLRACQNQCMPKRLPLPTRWAAFIVAALMATAAWSAPPLVVGSKRFTESYILGEIVRQTYAAQSIAAEHRQGLGNTGILEQALASGAVDVYPEYTGTIVRELLKRPQGTGNPSLAELNEWLAPRGLKAAVPLGFNNTYALAMLESRAAELGITRISDLVAPKAQALRLGLSHEFMERGDGWPAVKAAYKLELATGPGLDHGLAYDAVLLMRTAVDVRPLAKLEGRINAAAMIAMNAQVELDGRSFADVAKGFLAVDRGAASGATKATVPGSMAAAGPAASGTRQTFLQRLFAPDFARLTLQHLMLVFGSLGVAILIGVPLGIAAWRWPRSAGWVLGAVAVLQTVPSLALLAFLIALLGSIGLVPALIALFLYALLPIVRNTHAGLRGVPDGLAQAALSLGLTPRQCLREVQLPLAMPTLLAGVKTAAVINVGTATVAAFIGAGGYGERIVAGLAVNDTAAMLAGAVPSAVLALLVQAGFDWAERRLVRERV